MSHGYPDLYARLAAHCCEDGDCWTWVGSVRRHGGGDRPAVTMRVAGKKHPITDKVANPKRFNAARLMCELFHGPAPTPEHEASHLCEANWLCVHPWHLCWETKKENMARMWAKRRADAECDIDAGYKAPNNECPF